MDASGFVVTSVPFKQSYRKSFKRLISNKLSTEKKFAAIKELEALITVDVFEYSHKDELKEMQQLLLDIWEFYLNILDKRSSLSVDTESSVLLLVIHIIMRHEFKFEAMCNFTQQTIIGVSSRRLVIIERYRTLLCRSRSLSTELMRSRMTSDECRFVGCVFAVSFVRETVFHVPMILTIQRGFIEWSRLTQHINSSRAVHGCNFSKLLQKIMVASDWSRFRVDNTGESTPCEICDSEMFTLDDYFAKHAKEQVDQLQGFSYTVKPRISLATLFSAGVRSMLRQKSSVESVTYTRPLAQTPHSHSTPVLSPQGSAPSQKQNKGHPVDIHGEPTTTTTTHPVMHQAPMLVSSPLRGSNQDGSPPYLSLKDSTAAANHSVHTSGIKQEQMGVQDMSPAQHQVTVNNDSFTQHDLPPSTSPLFQAKKKYGKKGSRDDSSIGHAPKGFMYIRSRLKGNALSKQQGMKSGGFSKSDPAVGAMGESSPQGSHIQSSSPSTTAAAAASATPSQASAADSSRSVAKERNGHHSNEFDDVMDGLTIDYQTSATSLTSLPQPPLMVSPLPQRPDSVMFAVLNPSLYLWDVVYQYIDSDKQDYSKENWFDSLITNGGAFAAFVFYYHRYVYRLSKGDITWLEVPGYYALLIVVPIMLVESMLQSRSSNAVEYYKLEYTSFYDSSRLYRCPAFRLTTRSSDKKMMNDLIRLIPRVNPQAAFMCILAIYDCVDQKVIKDVLSYVTTSKELLKGLLQAKLSYYKTEQQLSEDESVFGAVVLQNFYSVKSIKSQQRPAVYQLFPHTSPPPRLGMSKQVSSPVSSPVPSNVRPKAPIPLFSIPVSSSSNSTQSQLSNQKPSPKQTVLSPVNTGLSTLSLQGFSDVQTSAAIGPCHPHPHTHTHTSLSHSESLSTAELRESAAQSNETLVSQGRNSSPRPLVPSPAVSSDSKGISLDEENEQTVCLAPTLSAPLSMSAPLQSPQPQQPQTHSSVNTNQGMKVPHAHTASDILSMSSGHGTTSHGTTSHGTTSHANAQRPVVSNFTQWIPVKRSSKSIRHPQPPVESHEFSKGRTYVQDIPVIEFPVEDNPDDYNHYTSVSSMSSHRSHNEMSGRQLVFVGGDSTGSAGPNFSLNERQDSGRWAVARCVVLLAIQYHQLLLSSNVDNLIAVLSAVYELRAILNNENYYQFMTTVFSNSLYFSTKYDTRLTEGVYHHCDRHGMKNLFCSLFCHWSIHVQKYIHTIMVFSVIKNNGNLLDLSVYQTKLVNLYSAAYSRAVPMTHGGGYAAVVPLVDISRVAVEFIHLILDEDIPMAEFRPMTDCHQNIRSQLMRFFDACIAWITKYIHDKLSSPNGYEYCSFNQSFIHSLGLYSELLFSAIKFPEERPEPEMLNMKITESVVV